jgi:hypothetical protein
MLWAGEWASARRADASLRLLTGATFQGRLPPFRIVEVRAQSVAEVALRKAGIAGSDRLLRSFKEADAGL